MKNKQKSSTFTSNSYKLNDWPWSGPCPKFIYNDNFNWPSISVVIPSFNQGDFLEKTIRSVLMQNYPKLELIVVDGGSSDQSLKIIKRYSDRLDFWVSEKDKGQANAINKGFKNAKGDIFYWINSDDYMLPKALYHVGSFKWGNHIGAVVGIGHKVDKNGVIKYTPKIKELTFEAFLRWLGYGNFMQPACFFSSKAWYECGPLNESLHYCLDVDLWLKIADKFEFGRINIDLAHALIHINAKTTAHRNKMIAETLTMIAQKRGGQQIVEEYLFKLLEDNKASAILKSKINHILKFKLFRNI